MIAKSVLVGRKNLCKLCRLWSVQQVNDPYLVGLIKTPEAVIIGP